MSPTARAAPPDLNARRSTREPRAVDPACREPKGVAVALDPGLVDPRPVTTDEQDGDNACNEQHRDTDGGHDDPTRRPLGPLPPTGWRCSRSARLVRPPGEATPLCVCVHDSLQGHTPAPPRPPPPSSPPVPSPRPPSPMPPSPRLPPVSSAPRPPPSSSPPSSPPSSTSVPPGSPPSASAELSAASSAAASRLTPVSLAPSPWLAEPTSRSVALATALAA